jgi:flagellar biosynthesis anti-sigma factor FlgM
VKIDPKHLPKVGGETPAGRPVSRGRVAGPEGQGSARPSTPPPTDGVVLTPRAEEFRQLRLRLQSLREPGQSDRVARLKALVEQGAYVVDGDRIAGAMLQDEPTASLLGLPPTR